MIQANELRIGNWVEYPHYNNDGTVKYFKIRDIYTDDDKIGLTDGRIQLPSSNLKYIKPISLTEEWLLRFGFEYFREGSSVLQKVIAYEGGNYPCTLQVSGSGIQICRSGIGAICPEIHFVHQLQNLYFALTGEELEVGL